MELVCESKDIFKEIIDIDKLLKTYEKAASFALEWEGLNSEDTMISLTFVSEEEIRQINKEYRGIDKVTDVLSFPQFENTKDIENLEKGNPYLLGDVVICVERALVQAAEYGHSNERELVYLFVHSMFHLLGYDHIDEEDKKEMRACEEGIMEKLDIPR